MALTGSLNINLKRSDWAGLPRDYADRVSEDNELAQDLQNVDKYVGKTNGSFVTQFHYTGLLSTLYNAGQYVGTAWNGSGDRVVKRVTAWVELVTTATSSAETFEVFVGSTAQKNPGGLFNDVADWVIPLSSGAFYASDCPGSGLIQTNLVWASGSFLATYIASMTGAATGSKSPTGLTVQIEWYPSGSW